VNDISVAKVWLRFTRNSQPTTSPSSVHVEHKIDISYSTSHGLRKSCIPHSIIRFLSAFDFSSAYSISMLFHTPKYSEQHFAVLLRRGSLVSLRTKEKSQHYIFSLDNWVYMYTYRRQENLTKKMKCWHTIIVLSHSRQKSPFSLFEWNFLPCLYYQTFAVKYLYYLLHLSSLCSKVLYWRNKTITLFKLFLITHGQ
jgi:hypothetical protein